MSRTLTVLMLLGIFGTGMLWAQSPGTFTPTGNMTTPRAGHTATLLPNGKVLIAGGSRERPASAELYDPATGTFTATGDMIRGGGTATLLSDGRVLVAGGYDPTAQFWGQASAELYDPSTGTFAATGSLTASKLGQTATPLADGTVLFAVATPWWVSGSRQQEFLAAGELYDPSTGEFIDKGAMPPGYVAYYHTASLLMNGTVLISGGGDPYDVGFGLADAELYDPASGTFAATGKMGACRFSHTATMLPDGSVLIAGGNGYFCDTPAATIHFSGIPGSLGSAELYDPSTGTFAATGNMTTARQEHTATLLNDGKVLITGGFNFRRGEGIVNHASAELYTPPLLVPAPVLLSLPGDGQGQGAILHSVTHQVASSSDPAVVGEALEIYCTGLGDGSVIPPQVTIGGRMAEVLFFGNAPGFAGLNQVNVRVPSGVAPGPAVPVRLTYLGRTRNEVTIGVR